MKKQTKPTVEVSKAETPGTENKVNEVAPNQGLILVKQKLSIAEKLDKIQSFDAIHGRYDYLTSKKKQLDQFANKQASFMGAELTLTDSEDNEVTISNPAIVEELVNIAKRKCQELIVKTEKEIETFEIQ